MIPGAEQYLHASSSRFWREQLANARFLLAKTEADIAALNSGGKSEYTIDSGQTRMTIKRAEFAGAVDALERQRSALLAEISDIEARLGMGGGRGIQVVPMF